MFQLFVYLPLLHAMLVVIFFSRFDYVTPVFYDLLHMNTINQINKYTSTKTSEYWREIQVN